MPKVSFRSGLLAVLATVLVCTVLLEVALRAAGRLPSNTTEGLFEQHGSAYRLRRNLTKVSRTPSFVATIHTNNFGFRDRGPGARRLGPNPYIAWVGDSLTFGNGVDYDDSFVGVFGKLTQKDGIDVVNLAVGGYHFSECEEMLYDFLDSAPTLPAKVAFVFTATAVASFDERYSDVFVKDGYIFQKSGWAMPYVIITLGNGSAAYCFFRDALRRIQGRLLPSGRAGETQAVQLFASGGPWAGAERPARFEARLARLEKRLRGSGVKLVYVYMPSFIDLSGPASVARGGLTASDYDFDQFRNLLRRHAERTATPFVDTTALLQAEYQKGTPLCFMNDPHYNAGTNRVIGKALYQALIQEQTQVSFATQ
jgi:hypothetical protein